MPRLWGGLPDDYNMCGQCVGSGRVPGPGTGDSKCPQCDGLGRIRKPGTGRSSSPSPSTESAGSDSTAAGSAPRSPAELPESYAHAVSEGYRAQADLLKKLDEIHSQLYPLALPLPPGVKRDPETDALYAEWRTQNRKLHDWIESLDPIAPGTEENLRQLFESWQGQGDP